MSMRCPKCGERGLCKDSRAGKDENGHTTTRRYRCSVKKCGWRWSTVEMIVQSARGKLPLVGGQKTLYEIIQERIKLRGAEEAKQRILKELGL